MSLEDGSVPNAPVLPNHVPDDVGLNRDASPKDPEVGEAAELHSHHTDSCECSGEVTIGLIAAPTCIVIDDQRPPVVDAVWNSVGAEFRGHQEGFLECSSTIKTFTGDLRRHT